ncbi:T9SS type A sorting domain-containing protein [Alkalitalea saponilacus]|uniref:Por secretion system C-terminal sorting domain-containing protein n=1 Tax=Alkalitalea saponilacus TaxID=889453 RepID=A0A1T5HT31_9BACT|nr:T9SS type A sorting domain-containing protein [Alkalitalea saponilacus]ASB48531.1 hypothetical protein CDL62_04950 [Alkalitalea saponilacus]SKC23845.1 Por secretion system C-terminal sorting domain-containing protein [Alkalitalea saponilacus]
MNKTIILLSFVCSFALQANTQTYNNAIVSEDSSWATLVYGLSAYNIPCYVETQHVYFKGDSSIASVSYKKVFSSSDRLHENINFEGLIREHNEKTFFIPASFDEEYLLYDFSFEAGSFFEYKDFRTRESVSLYVNNVDFIEINGFSKKRIEITASPDAEWIVDTWVEEIGSLSGILYPCYKSFLDGGVRNLLCYSHKNELIYVNPFYSECYYDSVGDITLVQTTEADNYNVFPNPVSDAINISCIDNTILLIEVFDNLGRRVYSQTHNETINVSSFSKGLLLLKVYDANQQVSLFKIIKK